MSVLSVRIATTKGGFNFRRSDGKHFFLVYHDDGSAILYAGVDADTQPQTAIVGLDTNVSDKLSEAQRWVLAYPHQPSEGSAP